MEYMVIIGISICIGKNLLGIGIKSASIFLYWWNALESMYKQ